MSTQRWQGGMLRVLLSACLALLACAASWAQAGKAPKAAPPVPKRIEEHLPRRGFVPLPVDLSHIVASMPATPQPMLPHFDWREAGKITPVKNQGACGSCYAFASVGNFEAKVLVDGGSTFNFSENNVKECEWYGSSCGGGNFWLVANFLAAKGTVLETCDPYVPAYVGCTSSCPYSKTLLDWCVISFDEVPTTDVLKAYIQTYGPVYTSMYAGGADAWYSELVSYDGTYTLYYDGPGDPNHAVLIVGWDDDLVHAGGQGAWIVKNSWGTFWGGPCGYGSQAGYFTIAYGSAKMGMHSSFISDWQNYDPNGIVFYHDEGGYNSSVGYGMTTAWGLCKFVPGEDVILERVEVWTLDATTDIDVYIYDTFNGTTVSNLLASELNHSFANAGYHSIELTGQLEVSSGDDIYAVVKITDDTYTYPMPFDAAGPKASGCCYISATGGSYSEWPGGDLGIRVRATKQPTCGGVMEDPAIVEIADVPTDQGGYVDLSWKRSLYDEEGASPEVRRYKIWRKRREILPPGQLGLVGEGVVTIGGPYEHGETGPAWELMETVAATGVCCYEYNAPTHCDSSGSDTCWTYFRVTAHTGVIGEHYDSDVSRGYSVDNLSLLDSEGGPDLPSQDPDGVGIGTAHLEIPEPNPGDHGFLIKFELGRRDWVRLELYDVKGRRIELLYDGMAEAGSHAAIWDRESGAGPALSPGLYFVRLMTTSEVHTAKLVLVR
jgi:C1A family cysteine protease